MKSTLLLSLFVLFQASTAAAIDSSRCPRAIELNSTVTRVFQSSIYSNVNGWREAQSELRAQPRFEGIFRLTSRTADRCVYRDNSDNSATLATSKFRNPEENKTDLVEQLILNLKLGSSSFVTFIAVESYGTNEFSLFGPNSTSQQKLKVRLVSPTTQKWTNFDIGMIEVQAHAR